MIFQVLQHCLSQKVSLHCLLHSLLCFKPKQQYSEEGNLHRQKAADNADSVVRMLTTLCQSYHVLWATSKTVQTENRA